MTPKRGPIKHRWRDYRTPAGRRPVAEFIAGLPEADAAEIAAAMKEVAATGLTLARHVRGDIWEVRAFAEQGLQDPLRARGEEGQDPSRP